MTKQQQRDCERWTRTLQELAVFPAATQKLNRNFRLLRNCIDRDLLLPFLSSRSGRHWRQAEPKVLDFICRFPSLVPKELQDSHVPRVSLAKRLGLLLLLLSHMSCVRVCATP